MLTTSDRENFQSTTVKLQIKDDVSDTTTSQSGILLHAPCGLVLTSGCLFRPLVTQNLSMEKIVDRRIVPDEEEPDKTGGVRVSFSVSCDSFATSRNGSTDCVPPKSYRAKAIGTWLSEEIESNLNVLFNKNLRLHYSNTDKSVADEIDKKLGASVLLLQMDYAGTVAETCGRSGTDMQLAFWALRDVLENTIEVKKSDRVWVHSTLFGEDHPLSSNALSQGIVVHSMENVFLTDARSTPGSEGGLVSHQHQNRRCFAGMLLSSCCWKRNDLIVFALAAKARPILSCILQQQVMPILNDGLPKFAQSPTLSKAMLSVVKVQSGSHWGSGIVVDSTRGIVLTCAHIVHGSASVVEVHTLHPQERSVNAKVLHCTPPDEVLDIAVLELMEPVPLETASYDDSSQLFEGLEVFAIGYGLFTDKTSDIFVTAGYISKIVTLQKQNVLFQTSCITYGGMSGGAVMDASTGSVVGMTCCHFGLTTTDSNVAWYPTVNATLPLSLVMPVVQRFLETGDATLLKSLYVKNNVLKNLWQFRPIDALKNSKL